MRLFGQIWIQYKYLDDRVCAKCFNDNEVAFK